MLSEKGYNPVKFSIITPSFNSARYIRETIQSVISQKGDFTIEYYVIDNRSTDGTKEIVEEFQQLLRMDKYPLGCNGVELNFISESDKGMYAAVNRGFEKATGDILAWLNADDIYLPGAFATITKVFTNYDDVHWLKGITSYITEDSLIWQTGNCNLYAQDWIKMGIYGRDHYFIQQDSVFWRAWLWKECGGINAKLKRAGDYDLWIKFAKAAPLITVRFLASCFRSVKGQLSEDSFAYMSEVKNISMGKDTLSTRVRLFFRFENRLPCFIRPYFFRLIFGRLEFSIILISSNGQLDKITGQFYGLKTLL